MGHIELHTLILPLQPRLNRLDLISLQRFDLTTLLPVPPRAVLLCLLHDVECRIMRCLHWAPRADLSASRALVEFVFGGDVREDVLHEVGPDRRVRDEVETDGEAGGADLVVNESRTRYHQWLSLDVWHQL